MTKSFVTIFVIIMMAMAVTLIRAHPAHSFAIWMLTCHQEAQSGTPSIQDAALLTNVDPAVPVDAEEACLFPITGNEEKQSTCADCLNALVNGAKKGAVPSSLEEIKVTYTQLNGDTLIQILIGL